MDYLRNYQQPAYNDQRLLPLPKQEFIDVLVATVVALRGKFAPDEKVGTFILDWKRFKEPVLCLVRFDLENGHCAEGSGAIRTDELVERAIDNYLGWLNEPDESVETFRAEDPMNPAHIRDAYGNYIIGFRTPNNEKFDRAVLYGVMHAISLLADDDEIPAGEWARVWNENIGKEWSDDHTENLLAEVHLFVEWLIFESETPAMDAWRKYSANFDIITDLCGGR